MRLPDEIQERNRVADSVYRSNPIIGEPLQALSKLGEDIGNSIGLPGQFNWAQRAYQLPNGMIFEVYCKHGWQWMGYLYKSYEDRQKASRYTSYNAYYEF